MPHAASSSELLTRAVSDVVPRKLAEEKLKSGKPLRLYLGIDPTGARLHLGHSVPLRKLKAFQDAGHEVIFLVGSYTAMIGDPSGRDQQRVPLTPDDVEMNFQSYKEQASNILDFSKCKIVYNHEWLNELDGKKLLQLSSHFTVQQMLERDMFQERMRKGLPIALQEFLYPLFVGYDSVVLDVDLEVGGNDQLFNMLAGRTLQQVFGKRDKFVLTCKLIEGTDGRKMSKTYDNCIWLEDGPNEMYGKLLSIRDDLILPYMECVTEMPMREVKEAEQSLKSGTNPKELKMHLAREVVTLYHGSAAAASAEEQFQHVFAKHGIPEGIPEVHMKPGETLIDLLARTKIVASKGEARRLIEQKGIHADDKPVTDVTAPATPGIVKVGKRRFVKIV